MERLASLADFSPHQKRSLVAAGCVGGYNPANPTCFSADLAPMTEVTRILSAIARGDPHAAEQLLPLVYKELRQLAAKKLAQEKPGQRLFARLN
jgi:ECF sigma factor